MNVLEMLQLESRIAEARAAVLDKLRSELEAIEALGFNVDLDDVLEQVTDLSSQTDLRLEDYRSDHLALAHSAAEDEPLDDELAELEEMRADPAPEDPAPIPKPAAQDEAPKTEPAPTAKELPLTDDETCEALRLDDLGNSPAAIAMTLGRSRRGFHFTMERLRREAAEGDDAPAEDHRADTAGYVPGPRQAQAETSSLMFQPAPGASLKEQSLHAMLNAIGYPEPWTPVADAMLAVMLANGEGVPAVVDALHVERSDVIARWNALLPQKGIDEQSLLVKVLKRRAEEHQGRKVAAE